MTKKLTKTAQAIIDKVRGQGGYLVTGKREAAAARQLYAAGLVNWEACGGMTQARTARGFGRPGREVYAVNIYLTPKAAGGQV